MLITFTIILVFLLLLFYCYEVVKWAQPETIKLLVKEIGVEVCDDEHVTFNA